MKVIYSPITLESLEEILIFLKNKWGEKQIKEFENDIENFIKNAKQTIISYPVIPNSNNLRYVLIAKKQVKLYFDLEKDVLKIILFWPCKKNPNKLKKLLK